MTKLADKTFAVTGAASGIGRALAIELAARGSNVALSDVDATGLEETVQRLGEFEVQVSGSTVDVSDCTAVEAWARRVLAEHGHVDGIINNAGMTAKGSIRDIPLRTFERVIDVDMWGVVHGVRAFLPYIESAGAGHIVNIASINAMVPFVNNGPYNMAKYAVLGLSETLMQELAGTGIAVTCVHPGGIRTNIARNAEGYAEGEAEIFDRIAKTSARSAAQQILDGVERDAQRVYVGSDAKALSLLKRLAPGLTVRLAGRGSKRVMGKMQARAERRGA